MESIDLLEFDIGDGQDLAEVLMLAAVQITHAAKARGLDPTAALASLREMADDPDSDSDSDGDGKGAEG